MSFLKKFSETMMDTASSIGAKSMDMVETGKLKLQQNQLESNIKDKKTEIGNLVYLAHTQNIISDTDALTKIFAEIKDLENQIAAIDEKLRKETVQTPSEAASSVSCSKCGQELSPGTKFCNNCGQAQ